MVTIKHILVPIDFSATSRVALLHAAALAKWFDARVTALHAVAPVVALAPEAYPFPAADPETMRQLEEDLRTWLTLADIGVEHSEAVVEEGDPRRVILERGDLPGTLIVMGTHGRRGFERLMLGSVAESVLRKALAPVLIVPPATAPDAHAPFKRVLCAVDFSPASIAAAQFATSIAQQGSGVLTFMHVLEWPDDMEMLVEITPAIVEARRRREAEAEQQLERLAGVAIGANRRPLWIIAHGKAYERIVETAVDEGTDLLVMGVPGRNIVERALLGSTTDQVVRRAPCPVLTLGEVRPVETAARASAERPVPVRV